MKKFLSVYIMLISFILTACNSSSTENRVSKEMTEKHFYECVNKIESFLKSENIPNYDYFDYEFLDDGYGYLYIGYDEHNIMLDIFLYNNTINPFGDDYKLGLEEYSIEFNTQYSTENELCSTDNVAYKIIPVALSYLTATKITETELISSISNIRSDIILPNYDKNTSYYPLVESSTKFNNTTIEYSLNYNGAGNRRFYEYIQFSGYCNFS